MTVIDYGGDDDDGDANDDDYFRCRAPPDVLESKFG